MKINEAEQLLGITKANIRFYEKEGLLTPSRNESSYREYSDAAEADRDSAQAGHPGAADR